MTYVFTVVSSLLVLLLVLPQAAADKRTKSFTVAATPAAVVDVIWGTQGEATNSKKVVLEEAHYVNGIAYPMIKGAILGKGGSSVCWLHVPDAKDWVLVNLNHAMPQGALLDDKKCVIEPGVVSYVNCYPLNPRYTLPAGLFFWYKDWEDLGEPTLGAPGTFRVRQYPGKDPYLWDDKDNVYVNQVTNEPYKPVDNRHPNDRAVRRWMYHDSVDLNKIFESTMCITEENFRKKLNAMSLSDSPGGAPTKTSAGFDTLIKKFNAVLKDLPEHAKKLFPLGFEKNFKAESVGELRSMYRASREVPAVKKSGKLFILKKSELDKDRKGYKADIRYLQAHFPGAVFQVVSTFGSTEKGASNYNDDLDKMSENPTQGDNAVMGTISGAIARRYSVKPEDRNLLYGLRDVFVGTDNPWSPHISSIVNNMSYSELVKGTAVGEGTGKITNNQALELAFSGAVRLGVHKNLFVTSGSWGKHDILIPLDNALFYGPGSRRVPAFNKRIDDPRVVHHIYTSAVNINPDLLKKDAQSLTLFQEDQFAIPKIMLRAVYEGTILAARALLPYAANPKKLMAHDLSDFLQEKKMLPRLFITLVGSGSFANEPEWIVTILEQLQALIYDSGLQICLVLWDDPKIAPLLERLEALSKRIQNGNVTEVSQAAEKAGELLWLFDNDGKIKPKVEKDTAFITLPIKKNDKPIALNIWQSNG